MSLSNMNDEFQATKSDDEEEENEASEDEEEKEEENEALDRNEASQEGNEKEVPGDTTNSQMLVPIQPFYPPYHHYPAMSSSNASAIYIDQSLNLDPPADRRNRGGVTEPFPEKLHRMLDTCEREGLSDVVGFFSHGRAFAIHKPRKFQAEIMPRFFRQTRLTSFQRQLNLYGFKRISQGPDHGGYWHEFFLRGRPGLCRSMKRVKIKGNQINKKDFEGEPNFYTMPPVMASLLPPPGPGVVVALPPPAGASPGQAAGGPPMQGPFGYVMQPGYGYPMMQQPGPFTIAQMSSGEGAAALTPGQSPHQQQQHPQQFMYPYPPPPFYAYPPPWMQQQPPPAGASFPFSPAQASVPAEAMAKDGEDSSPTKNETEV
jgi:hypothetical protein